MEHSGGLAGSLELASAFSSQINTGVPVEIVEAENQGDTVLRSENGAQNVSAEDAMEISVEADTQGVENTQLNSVGQRAVELSQGATTQAAAGTNSTGLLLPAIPGEVPSSDVTPSSQGKSNEMVLTSTQSHSVTSSTQAQSFIGSTSFTSGLPSSQNMLSSTQNPHSSQLTRTVMDQLSDAQGLEISTDAITSISMANANMGGGGGNAGAFTVPPQMAAYTSTPSVNSLMASRGHRDLLSGNMSYGDLDLSVGANSSTIDTSGVLNEPDSPSSPESNFDSSELLSNPLTQQDEVTQRLAQSGPIGIAAAAAIMSGSRKRKRQHTFETNPSFRKRHCSKLTKKLKETIDELAARVGLQAVVLTYRPGKGNGKNEPSFKVFGAAPLVNVVRNQRDSIVNEMEAALHQQAPPVTTPPTTQQGDPLFELPPLVFDGIPTPVHKMTQAQLRTFIPNMLKYSTGRGKPGWGKGDVRPPWWPDDVPWANVRSDIRTPEQKKALQWTDALRRIVINCYLHHGRMDLLPEFSLDQLQQYLTPQVAEQIQVQLDNMQQQEQEAATRSSNTGGGEVSMTTMNAESAAEEVAAALNEITEASGGVEGRDDPEMMVGDNQQVFTVDTGIGNCDMAGMPTLADASLAETAARLQQMADETGEVQYATQTVTVTDRDAKALGQPVGSTTTVLLTAYPGGHNGAAASATTTGGGAPGAAGGVAGGNSSVGGGVAGTGGMEMTGTATTGGDQSSIMSTTDASSHQQFLTSASQQQQQQAGASNVQVVYSASHVESIPGGTNPPNINDFTSSSANPMGGVTNETGGIADLAPPPSSQSMDPGSAAAAVAAMGVSDYLNPNPPSSQEAMLAAAAAASQSTAGMGMVEADTSGDLAAELIREYSLGGGASVGDGGMGGGEKEPSNQLTTPTMLPGTAGGGRAAAQEGEVKDSTSPES